MNAAPTDVSADEFKPRRNWDSLVGPVALAVTGFLVLVPLISLLYASFRTGSPGDPRAVFTLQNWSGLFARDVVKAMLNTFRLAIVATIGSMALGILLAWLVSRTDLPGRRTIQRLIILPMLVSTLLTTLSWIALAGPKAGFINLFWQSMTKSDGSLFNIYSFSGMAFLMILHFTPYVFLLVVGGFAAVDSSLEDAVRVHGGSVWYSLRRVVLPVLTPTLLAAGILVFVLASETFTIPTMLGASSRFVTIQYKLYYAITEYPSDPGTAAVLGTFMLAITLIGVWLQQRLRRVSKRYVTVSGKATRQHRVALGPWRYPALALALLYVTLAVVLPTVVLVLSSFLKYATRDLSQITSLLTTEHYRYVLFKSEGFRSLKNSLELAIGGSTITVALCAVLSFLIVRGHSRVTRVVEFLTALPLSMPGLSLALGLLWGYIYLPIGIYGTIWMLLVAYITRYMSFGIRIFAAGVAQVDPELEEAARVAGCRPLQSLFKVTLPILKPAAAAAWTLLFVQVILELPMTIILYSGESLTAPVNTWRLAYSTTFSPAYAMSALLLLLGVVVVGLGQWFFSALNYVGEGAE